MKLRKGFVSFLMSVVLAVGLVPVAAFAAGSELVAQSGETLQINGAKSVAGGVFAYEGGSVTVTVLSAATAQSLYTGTSNQIDLSGQYAAAVVLEPDEGYEASLWAGGSQVDLTNNGDGTYSYMLYVADIGNNGHVIVDPSFDQQGGGGGGGGVTNAQATITYSFEGEPAVIFLGDGDDNMAALPEGALNNEVVDYYYDDSGYVQFRFSTLFIFAISEVKVNGTDYSNQIPATKQDKLDHFANQCTEFTISVPKSETNAYTINTVANSDPDPAVGNFLWSYRDEDAGTDDYIDRGRLEFVSAEYDGQMYYADDLVDGSAFSWSENGEGDGGAVFPAGTNLTVKLVPNHGMQLISFGVNGGTFDTGENASEYSFEVAKGNFHLAAGFGEVEDAVVSTADAIDGGSIVLSDKDVPSGSAVLSVADADVSAKDAAALADAASEEGDYHVADVVDLSLAQVVYKGNNDVSKAWTASLGSEEQLVDGAQIELALAGDEAYADAIVVHQEHDGTCTVVDTDYDPVANTVGFEADDFSNYAIAVVEKNADVAAVYRLYNPNSGEHFFTMSESEYANVKAAGWNDEGVAWQAPLEGAEVYRLYNPNGGDHHFTMSAEERDMLKKLGWNDEGVAFCSADESGVPVHRLYNPNALAGNHLFTASQDESDFVKAAGWNYEGIGWYAVDAEGEPV